MNQVLEFFKKLVDSSDWPPRWHCGRWTEFHGWLYIISDLLIWSAYFTIPVVILRYISKKQGIRFVRLYFLFAAFILACGATHFLDAAAFWIPAYRLNALVRLITGVLSWTTVFYLVKLLPVAFSLKSQKELETEIEQRKKAEEKFKGLLESAPDAMIIADTKGNIVLVNRQTELLFGYKREELTSQPVELLVPQGERDKHEEHRAGYYKEPKVRSMGAGLELFAVKKDGSLFPVEISLSPLETSEGLLVSAAIRDITERKKSEEAIKQLNKELESFTYSVSHDLRSPLRIIDGYADILITDYQDKLDEEGNRVLGIVKSNAQRMGQLIDDLLNLSQIGRKELIMHLTDMNKIVRSVIDEQISSSGSHASIKLGNLEPTECDSSLIRQVWINLISNAIKYSGTRSRPTIEINSIKTGNEIVYSIKDNGAGFDMKYADKLFGVFQRLHKMTEFEGTGVGLALVHRIITRQGGRVWAEAEAGKGATFYFSLPCMPGRQDSHTNRYQNN